MPERKDKNIELAKENSYPNTLNSGINNKDKLNTDINIEETTGRINLLFFIYTYRPK